MCTNEILINIIIIITSCDIVQKMTLDTDYFFNQKPKHFTFCRLFGFSFGSFSFVTVDVLLRCPAEISRDLLQG